MTPKKWPIAQKRNFFLGGPRWTGVMPCWQKSRFQNKILNFGPKYPNFWVKIAHFVPSGQFEPHRSMSSTRKRCLIGSLIWGYQKRIPIVLPPSPQKNYFRPKNGQIWARTFIFCPFDPIPDQKTMGISCLGGYSVFVGTKTFTYSHKNQDFWSINGQIWPKIGNFGHFEPGLAG